MATRTHCLMFAAVDSGRYGCSFMCAFNPTRLYTPLPHHYPPHNVHCSLMAGIHAASLQSTYFLCLDDDVQARRRVRERGGEGGAAPGPVRDAVSARRCSGPHFLCSLFFCSTLTRPWVQLHPGVLSALVADMEADASLPMATGARAALAGKVEPSAQRPARFWCSLSHLRRLSPPACSLCLGYPFDVPPPGANLLAYCALSYHLPLLVAFSVRQRIDFVWYVCWEVGRDVSPQYEAACAHFMRALHACTAPWPVGLRHQRHAPSRGGCMLFRAADLRSNDRLGLLAAWSDGGCAARPCRQSLAARRQCNFCAQRAPALPIPSNNNNSLISAAAGTATI